MIVRLKYFNNTSQITFAALILSLVIFNSLLGQLINLPVVWFFYLFFLVNMDKLFSPFRFNRLINLYILLLGLFLISSLIYPSLLSELVGDFFNILWWTLYCLLLSKLISSSFSWQLFLKRLSLFLLVGGTIISILSLYKFVQASNGMNWKSLYVKEEGYYIGGSAFNSDYNIFSLNMFICALSGKYFLDNYSKKKIGYIFLIPIILSATLSGSRRALILLAATLFILIFDNFHVKVIKKNPEKSTIFKKLLLFLIVLILLINYNFLLSIFHITTNSVNFLNLTQRWGTINTTGIELRESYWYYGFELFSIRNYLHLLFGDGFNYMIQFQHFFKTPYPNYPHNFIISSLLYGGVFSTILLLILINNLIILYFKKPYLKYFRYWFIFCIFIALTSSNTIYSTRLNIILLALPLIQFNNYIKVRKLNNFIFEKSSTTVP